MTKSAALWVYQNIGRGAHPDKQLAIIQSALDEAHNNALEAVAKIAEAQKRPSGFIHYTTIRAMKAKGE